MLEFLNHLFGCVCGQNPDHTWSPGGELLPFCQRCTGLYVGAFMAAVLHLMFRPAPTNRWLWLNGCFLLFMVPFGFHWLPQGPVLRTITGVLFGFGLVAFLTLTLGRAGGPLPTGTRTRYLVGILTTLFLIPWLGANGNALAANTLTLLGTGGALALFGLALLNAALALVWLIRCFFNFTSRAAA